jgi:hypothetical protein
VVAGTPRDSLYVLDVLYDRDGGRRPEMIVTDTASYSDIVFGLLADGMEDQIGALGLVLNALVLFNAHRRKCSHTVTHGVVTAGPSALTPRWVSVPPGVRSSGGGPVGVG